LPSFLDNIVVCLRQDSIKNKKAVGANASSLYTAPGAFPYLTGKFPGSFNKLGVDI